MKAYVLGGFDEAPALRDVPEPHSAPREIRVRVLASSVNPADRMTALGGFRGIYDYRFPAVLGRDFAGVVDEVGTEVDGYRVGDEVFGFVKREHVGDGSFAEYLVLPDDRFAVRRPAELPLPHAGVLGLAGVTALQCLDALDCRPGQSVLVNGATGGVGAFAVQLARRRGLEVVATARPGPEEEHVTALGASLTIDWWDGGVAARIRDVRPGGVAGIVDLVSKDAASMTSLAAACLAPGGTAVSTLSAAPRDGEALPFRLQNVHSSGDADLLERLAAIAGDGLAVPLVDVYPLDRIDDAFRALEQGPLGKVGLRLD